MLVSLAAWLATPSFAPAASPTRAQGTFSISPARRDLVGRPPVTLVPTRVSNTTENDYDVRVSPVLLHQGLTGAFDFEEAPAPLAAARTILRASPSRFRLGPGESRAVALTWRVLPIGDRAAYIGVIFEGRARLKNGGSVPVITRLLSTNFLRVPGNYRLHGKFSALNVVQFAPKVLRVLPRVKNTGERVGSPENAHLSIRDAAGRTRYKTAWTGDVILPGAQREFPLDIDRVLPAGRYTANAAMDFGFDHHVQISTPFTLVGPNELPTPGVKISGFGARGDVGGPAHVEGRMQSTGTAPANLDLKLALFRLEGGLPSAAPLARGRLRYAAIAPRGTRRLDADLATALTAGSYRVVATYTDPTGAPRQLGSDFAATTERSLIDRVKRFIDRHSSLVIGAGAFIVVALLLLLLLRRQRRLESELRTVRAQQERAAPPS